MFESVIMMLIYIAIIALVVTLVFWVLETVGIPIPAKVKQIIWLIVALIVILWLVKTFIGTGPPGRIRLGELPSANVVVLAHLAQPQYPRQI
jgi:hypothetical protein